MQIRKLEEEFGVSLLVRHSRGAYATEAGEALAEHATGILRRVEVARDELQRFRGLPSGRIRLGITPSLGRVLAPELLERALDLMPDIELSLVQGFGEQLDSELRAGRLDLAFSPAAIADSRFQAIALFGERMHLIGAPSLIGALPETLVIESLADLPLALDSHVTELRRRLDALIARRGAQLKHDVEVDTITIRREIVVQGHRATITPYALFAAEIEQGLVVARAVEEPEIDRTLYLNAPAQDALSRGQAAILRLILDLIGQHVEGGRLRWLKVAASGGS